MIPPVQTIYVNMFGPVDIYQNAADTIIPTNEEVCGRLISTIEDHAEAWMILAGRLDLIESTNPNWLRTYELSWENSIFYSCPEGEFFKVTAAQYGMLSRVSDHTVLIIKEQGVHEVQFTTHGMLKSLLNYREANGRQMPLIACDTDTIEQLRNLGPIILTTLLFLHVGQIRNLTCEQFTLLSPCLPVGCCHLVSQTQLQGLDFAYFDSQRLEALVRGSGVQSEFVARLRILTENQMRHLVSKSTAWLRENLPSEILQNISMDDLILSLNMLRV